MLLNFYYVQQNQASALSEAFYHCRDAALQCNTYVCVCVYVSIKHMQAECTSAAAVVCHIELYHTALKLPAGTSRLLQRSGSVIYEVMKH